MARSRPAVESEFEDLGHRAVAESRNNIAQLFLHAEVHRQAARNPRSSYRILPHGMVWWLDSGCTHAESTRIRRQCGSDHHKGGDYCR